MRTFFLTALIFTLAGCGQPDAETSVSADIGTNLAEDGTTRLYVVDGERIVRGQCRDYVLRSACYQNIEAKNYAEFKLQVRALAAQGESAAVDADLADLFDALESRIIYQVTGTNQLFLRFRPYVKLFDQAFAASH